MELSLQPAKDFQAKAVESSSNAILKLPKSHEFMI